MADRRRPAHPHARMPSVAQPRWLRQVQADPTRLHDLGRCIARLLSDPTVAERVRERLTQRTFAATVPSTDMDRHACARNPGDHDMLAGWTAFQPQDTPTCAPVGRADDPVGHDLAAR